MTSTDSGRSSPVGIVSEAISRQTSSDALPREETTRGPEEAADDEGGPRSEEVEPELEDQSERLALDRVFEILKNARRRETLHYLRDNGGESSLSELAEHIAALENDTTVAGLTSKQRKRVYVGLYQCHLPKMDDTDVIDFDQNRGTVRLSDNAEQLYPYLEKPDPRSWHRLYATIAVLGAVLFTGSLLTDAASGVALTVLLGGLIVSIGGCALVDGYTNGS